MLGVLIGKLYNLLNVTKSGPNSLFANSNSNSSIICIYEFVSESFAGCFGDILFGLMLEFVVIPNDFSL